MKAADDELINVARIDPPSVLRKRSYGGLCQENWMAEVTSELTSRCPVVTKILSCLFDCNLVNPGKKQPPICLVYAMIMFLRSGSEQDSVDKILNLDSICPCPG